LGITKMSSTDFDKVCKGLSKITKSINTFNDHNERARKTNSPLTFVYPTSLIGLMKFLGENMFTILEKEQEIDPLESTSKMMGSYDKLFSGIGKDVGGKGSGMKDMTKGMEEMMGGLGGYIKQIQGGMDQARFGGTLYDLFKNFEKSVGQSIKDYAPCRIIYLKIIKDQIIKVHGYSPCTVAFSKDRNMKIDYMENHEKRDEHLEYSIQKLWAEHVGGGTDDVDRKNFFIPLKNKRSNKQVSPCCVVDPCEKCKSVIDGYFKEARNSMEELTVLKKELHLFQKNREEQKGALELARAMENFEN